MLSYDLGPVFDSFNFGVNLFLQIFTLTKILYYRALTCEGIFHLVEKLNFDDASGSNPCPQDVLFCGDVIWSTDAVEALQKISC